MKSKVITIITHKIRSLVHTGLALRGAGGATAPGPESKVPPC
jgi:hypothetical protein